MPITKKQLLEAIAANPEERSRIFNEIEKTYEGNKIPTIDLIAAAQEIIDDPIAPDFLKNQARGYLENLTALQEAKSAMQNYTPTMEDVERLSAIAEDPNADPVQRRAAQAFMRQFMKAVDAATDGDFEITGDELLEESEPMPIGNILETLKREQHPGKATLFMLAANGWQDEFQGGPNHSDACPDCEIAVFTAFKNASQPPILILQDANLTKRPQWWQMAVKRFQANEIFETADTVGMKPQ